eukprot:4267481-Prorocentrum_lima.AAC.1
MPQTSLNGVLCFPRYAPSMSQRAGMNIWLAHWCKEFKGRPLLGDFSLSSSVCRPAVGFQVSSPVTGDE